MGQENGNKKSIIDSLQSRPAINGLNPHRSALIDGPRLQVTWSNNKREKGLHNCFVDCDVVWNFELIQLYIMYFRITFKGKFKIWTFCILSILSPELLVTSDVTTLALSPVHYLQVGQFSWQRPGCPLPSSSPSSAKLGIMTRVTIWGDRRSPLLTWYWWPEIANTSAMDPSPVQTNDGSIHKPSWRPNGELIEARKPQTNNSSSNCCHGPQ